MISELGPMHCSTYDKLKIVFFSGIRRFLCFQVNAHIQEANTKCAEKYDPHKRANIVPLRCTEYTNGLIKKFYFHQTVTCDSRVF